MVLHPKIQALRNNYQGIRYFNPTNPVGEVRSPKVENDRLVKQYFAIWGVPDDYGTVPIKGCFAKSLQERGPKSNSNSKIVVLWQHDQREPLCLPKVLVEDEIGLYGEYEPDDIPIGNRCILQVRSGTLNNGSYGFNYVWDKMEYDEATDKILMYETHLWEVSPVTIGSQRETFAIRSADGKFEDTFLEDEIEDLIKQLPRKHHLELRSLINRSISLAKLQPSEPQEQTLETREPKQEGIDYNYLISKLNF